MRPGHRAGPAAAVLAAAALSSGCLVLSLQPAYDDQSVVFEEALVGRWRNAEDNVEITVERGEWRSYKILYKHPVDEAEFSAHLTAIGEARYLDLMPMRGLDYGAVLIPAHLVVKITAAGGRWNISAPDYDRLRTQVRAGKLAGAAFDQRQHIVLTGSTETIRGWLRGLHSDDFTTPATFERIDR